MAKQTKNIITLEWVAEELRFQNQAAIKSALVLIGAFALFCLPITAGIVYGIFSVIENSTVKILLSFTVAAIMCAPVFAMILAFRRAIAEKGMLDRGEFEIITRDVLYKEEKVVKRHVEKFLYFGDLESVQVDQSRYDLTDKGDTFYIVRYKNSAHVTLLYPTKTYEYK